MIYPYHVRRSNTTQHLSRTPDTTKHCPNTENRTHPHTTQTLGNQTPNETTNTNVCFPNHKHSSLAGTRTVTYMQLGYVFGLGSNIDRGSSLSNRVLLLPSCSWHRAQFSRESRIVMCLCTGTLVLALLVYTLSPFCQCGRCCSCFCMFLTRPACSEHVQVSCGCCRCSSISGCPGKM